MKKLKITKTISKIIIGFACFSILTTLGLVVISNGEINADTNTCLKSTYQRSLALPKVIGDDVSVMLENNQNIKAKYQIQISDGTNFIVNQSSSLNQGEKFERSYNTKNYAVKLHNIKVTIKEFNSKNKQYCSQTVYDRDFDFTIKPLEVSTIKSQANNLEFKKGDTIELSLQNNNAVPMIFDIWGRDGSLRLATEEKIEAGKSDFFMINTSDFKLGTNTLILKAYTLDKKISADVVDTDVYITGGTCDKYSKVGYATGDLNSIERGSSINIQIFGSNSAVEPTYYSIQMSDDKGKFWDKIPAKTIDPGQTVEEKVSTSDTTALGRHTLRIISSHLDSAGDIDCDLGYVDLPMTVCATDSRTSDKDCGSTGNPGSGIVAIGTSNGLDIPTKSFSEITTIKETLLKAIAFLRYPAFGAFVAISVAGITYITSGGNPTRAEMAKKSLLYVIAGISILSFAYLIFKVVLVLLKKI